MAALRAVGRPKSDAGIGVFGFFRRLATNLNGGVFVLARLSAWELSRGPLQVAAADQMNMQVEYGLAGARPDV